jgi:hypothetical protein
VERMYWERPHVDCATVLENAIRWAIGPCPLYRTTAPDSIEITLFRQGNELVVHLVDGVVADGHPGSRNRAAENIEIIFDRDRLSADLRAATTVVDVSGAGPVTVRYDDRELRVLLHRLDEFATVRLRSQPTPADRA